jgi:hypothetical protein
LDSVNSGAKETDFPEKHLVKAALETQTTKKHAEKKLDSVLREARSKKIKMLFKDGKVFILTVLHASV